MAKEVDLTVIGGGPGGYVCAIRASQLGVKTILVERAGLGGECLVAGCIPSKSLISVAKAFGRVQEGARFGIHATGLTLDVAELQSWKESVIATLQSGIATLCRGNGVEILKGEAKVEAPGVVSVEADTGRVEIRSRNVVIATGSIAAQLPGLEFDGKVVVGSRDALNLRSLPKRMLVVGGGYIGLEIACLYQRLGSEIVVVELMEQLLPGTEQDLVRPVQRNLEKRGASIHLKSRVASLERFPEGVRARVETPKGVVDEQAGIVLVSVGRRPSSAGLGLEAAGVEIDSRGFIRTDSAMRTSVDGIYAVGDVRGMPLLAHKAQKEGVVAAESIAGLPTVAEWKAVPWAIFTDPEIAGVGLTEREAVEAGHQTKRSRFPFAALGRALATGDAEGFVRVISDAQSKVVLGVQIVGPEASDLISEAALAVEMGATLEDLALTMHPHPTLPEALMEAAESGTGRPIHQMKS